jgi:hypothetical protein
LLAERKIWLRPVVIASSNASRAKYHVAPICRDLRMLRVRWWPLRYQTFW